MGNYKGIKFNNTMEGFKQWTREFPPMDKDAVKAKGYQKKDDLYLELQLVQGFITDSKFVSASVRKFDPESANFENVGFNEEKELLNTVFRNKVQQFEEKHNAKLYK